jgi:methionine-gamma-lyase
MGVNEHGSGRDGFATRAVHAGEAPDPTTGAHGTPLYQNATYAFHSFDQLTRWREGREPHFVYSRDSNPTVRVLEVKLANLEGAQTAAAAANGMAAIAATLLHLARDGGHVIVSDELYHGTQEFLACDLPAAGARVTSVNVRDLDAVSAAIDHDTRAILIEVVSNPSLRVADLDAIAVLAHSRGVTLVVDNTFLSPALLRPLEHGAHVVIHSATKYLSGHGQVLGGIVCGSAELIEPVRDRLVRSGGTITPFAAWTLLAGVKTLPLRVARHSENALRLARLLHGHPAVAEVNYPGLPYAPGHRTIRALVGDQFGGMLSFRLRDGVARHHAFFAALRIPALAVSLGDCGSLIWPYSNSDLIRFSVGIEDPKDLEADLRQALDAAS